MTPIYTFTVEDISPFNDFTCCQPDPRFTVLSDAIDERHRLVVNGFQCGEITEVKP